MAAIKTAAKLSQVFDFSLIRINPPLSNDFGDMALEGKDFKEWYERSDKWKMDDDLFQKWVLNKIDSIEKLKKNIHCKKLIKTINGS